jgi:hypothetical protein
MLQRRPAARTGLIWFAVTLATLLVAALMPLLWDSRFYYSGDTQTAYLGWWYELGKHVRHGNLPLLDVQSWRAGNAVAEGQWGLFSPLTIAIGVLTSFAPDVLVLVTVVKVALVLVSGAGVFLLVRSYRVPLAGAYVAGVVAPLCGQAQYGDWSSWVNGLMATALLPWAWWAVRRVMLRGTNPFPALFACYLVVTIGYVYGTLYLGLVLAGSLVECGLARNRAGFVKVLLIGACSALIAVTVYLPGVLTAPVTIRDRWAVVGEGNATVDLDTLFTSVLPTSLAEGTLFPYRYVAWLLPLLAWVDVRRVRARLPEMSGLVVVSAALVAWVLGPQELGPIRWPLRVLPALALVAVVLVVVLLTTTLRRPPSGLRLMLSLGWVALAWWVVTARSGAVETVTVVGALVVASGVVLSWSALRLGRPGAAAAVAGLCTLAVLGTQHAYFPDTASPDRNLPARAADYRGQLSSAVGDTIAVGSAERAWHTQPGTADEVLVGSTWYLNPHPIHNAGTAISFRTYYERFCMRWSGSTCPFALAALFEREPRTGLRWVDLMAVSTVLIVRGTYPGMRLLKPPAGWHLAVRGVRTVTWVRDSPVPTAGGVVWSSPDTLVENISSTDRDVSFRVRAVPSQGGRVVLSRLAWPGYDVDGAGARLGSPLKDMLLTVVVPPGTKGAVVHLHYSPPGWRLELLTWWLGAGLAVLWSLAHLVLRRRAAGRGDRGSTAEESSQPTGEPRLSV